MSFPYCKNDGAVIIIGSGTLEDQQSHERGFCSKECEMVWEATKQAELGRVIR